VREALAALRRSLDRIFESDAARIGEEMGHHLELLAREFQRQGLPPDKAQLAALRRFGDPDKWRAACDAAAPLMDTRRNSMQRPRSFRVLAAAVPLLVLLATTYMQQLLWRFAFYPASKGLPSTRRRPRRTPSRSASVVAIISFTASARGRRTELSRGGSGRPCSLVSSALRRCSSACSDTSGRTSSVFPILYLTVVSLLHRANCPRAVTPSDSFTCVPVVPSLCPGGRRGKRPATSRKGSPRARPLASFPDRVGQRGLSWLVYRWKSSGPLRFPSPLISGGPCSTFRARPSVAGFRSSCRARQSFSQLQSRSAAGRWPLP
jgi:hypothetical protein